MVMPEQRLNGMYSFADYLGFAEDLRCEIIDGTLYNMTPAPTPKHQDVLGQLYRKFSDYLDGKSCRVYIAPFDVRLLAEGKGDEEVTNVVQPDLFVVCEDGKIDEKGCNGSPDLVVEVLSPATAKKDKGEKLRLYRSAKVKEYWIVDPANETVDVYVFGVNHFPTVYGKEDVVGVSLFESLEIELKSVFR